MASIDGLTLHKQVNELKRLLTGGKIDKVNQPDRDELNIVIRNSGESYRLLVCAEPSSCRIQLTQQKKPNPADAPMFCMLLRKHLSGGRIKEISQPETDRIVRICIENRDELYNSKEYTLICEIMGRTSNIILTDENGIIIDSIRRIGIGISQARAVMPGLAYENPPTEKKMNPLCAKEADIEQALLQPGRVYKLLSSAFYGVAPIVCSMLTEYADEYTENMSNAEKDAVTKQVYAAFSAIDNDEKVFIAKCGENEQFCPFLPSGYEYKEFLSPSEMAESYYSEKEQKEFMRRRAYSLTHSVEQKIQRLEKRLSAFDEAIAGEGDYDKYRVYGELVTANLYRIKSGQTSVVADNYYENPPMPVEIPLDAACSGTKNAQKYFKLYKKAKGARDTAIAMREGVIAEEEYLKTVLDCIERAESVDELSAIRAELEEQKYIRHDRREQKKAKKQPPHKYVSEDGFEILVGRNNVQNDELTFKIASPYDIWLHVKDRPGSHTVIINKSREQIPDTTLYEAACIAALHSSAGEGGAKTEVDYTYCKYVKKPAGALPGKVIYTNQKTILAVPVKQEDYK